jgi:hypothetical protein
MLAFWDLYLRMNLSDLTSSFNLYVLNSLQIRKKALAYIIVFFTKFFSILVFLWVLTFQMALVNLVYLVNNWT